MRSAISNRASQTYRNLNPYPVPTAGTVGPTTRWGSGQAASIVTTELITRGWGNYDAMRATIVDPTISIALRMGYNGIVPTNGRITYRFMARTSGTLNGQTVSARIRQGTSTANLVSTDIDLSGIWTEYKFTRDLTGVTGNLSIQVIINANQGAVGDTVELTALQFVSGPDIPGIFATGDTLGWKWEGTPGASTSVGYPYTLASISGVPWMQFEGIGSLAMQEKMAINEDRTVFAVWDFYNQTIYPPIVRLDNTSNGNHNSTLYGHVSSNQVFARVQTSAVTSGVDYRDVSLAGPRTNGRHVGSYRTSGGMATLSVAVSNSVGALQTGSAAIPVAAQHQANRLAASLTTDTNPVFAAVYRGVMSDATHLAVLRYLSVKYSLYLA